MLQDEIDCFLASAMPDEEHQKAVTAFLDKLLGQIRTIYPTAFLKRHGSSACGLATKMSDVDLILGGVDEDSTSCLSTIYHMLVPLYPPDCTDSVLGAKVPIVRVLDDACGVDSDISFAPKGLLADFGYRTRLLQRFGPRAAL